MRGQKLIAANLAVGASLIAFPALAQDDVKPSNANPADEIVVTAQRREQSLQEVPLSVNVVSGDALEKANITSLEQLAVQLPAVRIAQTPASDQLHIRGTGSGLNGGFEQSVATFVDGVYRGRARSSRSALFDVARIEILKGPQTTFFGNNAIAGAFNITSRKPAFQTQLNASALAGSDGEYNLEAGATVPVSDKVALRAATRFSGMNGYVTNNNLRRDEPRVRDWIGRISLLVEPSETFTSNLRVDIGRSRVRGSYPGELTRCPPDPAFGLPRGACAAFLAAAGTGADTKLNLESDAPNSAFHNDFAEVAFSNDLDLGSHQLSSITSYFHHDNFAYSNVIPTPQAGFYGAPERLPVNLGENYKQFTQELRLTSAGGGKLDYMVGAYYLHGDIDFKYAQGLFFLPLAATVGNGFPANQPATIVNSTSQIENTFSVFGSFTYHLMDSLRLNGGIRYSVVKKRASRSAVAGVSNGPPHFLNLVGAPPVAQGIALAIAGFSADPFLPSRRTDKKLMPSASVEYDLADDAMLYGSYTKGFKAGGFSFFTPETFAPEFVDSFEVGIKSQLFDRALTLNVAAFLANYKNLQEASQILLPSGVPKSVIGNSAKSRSKGFEVGAILKAWQGIALHADVAYLDSRYVSYTNAPCGALAGLTAGCSQDLSNKKRSYSPTWSGSVGGTLTLPVANVEFKLEPTLAFSSGFFQQALNDRLYYQPNYYKLDLRASVGDPDRGWELAVIGRNLNDKITASFRNVVPTSPGSVLALPERGRSVAVQFSIRR